MKDQTTYTKVAKIINKVLEKSDDISGMYPFKPRVEALERGSDGWVILLNDDAYDMTQYKGYIQDIFYAGETIVVGNDDLYLEAYSDGMTFKVAR